MFCLVTAIILWDGDDRVSCIGGVMRVLIFWLPEYSRSIELELWEMRGRKNTRETFYRSSLFRFPSRSLPEYENQQLLSWSIPVLNQRPQASILTN